MLITGKSNTSDQQAGVREQVDREAQLSLLLLLLLYICVPGCIKQGKLPAMFWQCNSHGSAELAGRSSAESA
jgi:hypothetical protein